MRRRSSTAIFLALAMAGAALGFLLARQRSRRRLADQVGGAYRRVEHRLEREADHLRAEVVGAAERAAHPQPEPPVDDIALLDRVESELFADQTLPKGSVNLEVQEGVVVLRGQVSSEEEIQRLKAATWRIPGVRGVLSYLHLPGTPAPNKEAALRVSEVAEWREGLGGPEPRAR